MMLFFTVWTVHLILNSNTRALIMLFMSVTPRGGVYSVCVGYVHANYEGNLLTFLRIYLRLQEKGLQSRSVTASLPLKLPYDQWRKGRRKR